MKAHAAPATGQLNFRAPQGTGAIEAAKADSKERRFSMVAYTGGPIGQCHMGWECPVVIDLDGLDLRGGHFPILYSHGPVTSFFSSSAEDMMDFVVGQAD